ncbi:MAG: hypothetical protein KF845_14125 [Cyclobacteriaceae bacterium]|nr:hypothetical protein [Cyclobacteriaceae bacterium]
MKTLLTFGLILALAIPAWATVRTVSSNPATIGQFSTIQAAIDASTDGDTVYVYGSPNVYAAFTIMDKKIAVIGPGWAPDKNLPHTVRVAGATIRNSPAPGSPDGSELHGLVFTAGVTVSRNQVAGDIPVNNIRIIRCQFSYVPVIWELGSTGFLIEGSVFYTQPGFSQGLRFTSTATYENFLVQNNIFYILNSWDSGLTVNNLTNGVNIRFDHNLFYSNNNGGGGAYPVFVNCRFLTLSNNIFNQANAGLGLSFSTFNNNITNNITLSAANATSNATPWNVNNNVDGGGNVANGNPGMADQTAVNSGDSSPLLNFTIASGPANNSGSDGKDMGLLYDATGSLNWNNSRNSRLPRIFSMNITNPTVTPGGNLNVTVDARKSN